MMDNHIYVLSISIICYTVVADGYGCVSWGTLIKSWIISKYSYEQTTMATVP